MEQEKNYIQEQDEHGAYVVPLDYLRSEYYETKVLISGDYPGSGILATFNSGKAGFLKQIHITNYSGAYPVNLRFGDAATAQSGFVISGSAHIVHVYITSGNANPYGFGGTHIIEYIPAVGPYTSGIVVVSGGARIGGVVTCVTQVDPQTTQ